MNKVLFIIPTLTQTNGIASFMYNYIRGFNLNKFCVEILYNDLRTSKTYIDFFKTRGINAYKLPYVRDIGVKKYYKSVKTFLKSTMIMI